MQDLLKYSLNNQDIQKAVGFKVPIIRYSELYNFDNIWKIFDKKHMCFCLLYETADHYGHWTCLFVRKNKRGKPIIEHFDSYGFKPDQELTFAQKQFRDENNMDHTYLLKLLYDTKLPIEYNQFKLQKEHQGINTCGRWCVLRLITREYPIETFAKVMRSHGDPDEFSVKLTEPLIS